MNHFKIASVITILIFLVFNITSAQVCDQCDQSNSFQINNEIKNSVSISNDNLLSQKNSSEKTIPDITGIWVGEWYSNQSLSGRSEFNLTQTGSKIKGSHYTTDYKFNKKASYSVTGSIDIDGNVILEATITWSEALPSGYRWCSYLKRTAELSKSLNTISGYYSGSGCYGTFSLNGYASYGDNNAGDPVDNNTGHGDPVNIINGNMYIVKTDFPNPAPGVAFEFIRTYNSMSETGGPLGVG